MTDDDLCAAFEAGTLPKEEFRHREHLRVAFVYLSRLPSDAVPRFCQALLRFATLHGVAAKYKHQVTLEYLDRIRRSLREGRYRDSEEFLACHPELFHA